MAHLFRISLFALCAVLWACGESKPKNETESETGNVTPEVTTSQEAASPEVQAQISEVYAAYLKIKDALVLSDASVAAKAAAEMQASLKKITADTGVGNRKAFLDLIAAASLDAERIAVEVDIVKTRTLFSALSTNMYSLLVFHGGVPNKIYRQYCPMAFNDNGAYWLSNEEDIKNPYFGDEMLECGEVKETITPKP